MRRKSFFSVLPLVVFLAPALPQIPFFGGLGIALFAERQPASAARRAAGELDSMQARLRAAKQMLERRTPESTDFVTLAVEDAADSRIHLLKLAKTAFLNKDAEVLAKSSLGKTYRLRVVRSNYVNTSVRVTDEAGRELQPLLVQYPVEKNGALHEVAYYSSAHPAIHSPALVTSGGAYVRRALDGAATRLAAKGKRISPDIVDVAERLCVVEHTDHKRFEAEDRASLYEEIYTLYALNSGDTYRFSVSSAGAGGMVQMIPPTYEAMRLMYPSVGLDPDFVEGMRDHGNALEAMLLYMQGTWDGLLRSEQVRRALEEKTATQAELLAAGYNSNPVRLPRYLERGGEGWRTLIPEETKMYLRIYASVEGLVDFNDRPSS
ncbi:MAG: hypothetical protein LC802_23225 [Acidobacteria bacterium]|nr:hypothetical protein [Acidobacteriota bacterium]